MLLPVVRHSIRVVLRAAGCGALLGLAMCRPAQQSPRSMPPQPEALESGPPANETATEPEATLAPIPTSLPAPVVVTPGPNVSTTADEFDALTPLYRSYRAADGFLRVNVEVTDRNAWDRVADASAAGPLWAGHRLEPAEVRALGVIHVVSHSGVTRLEKPARFSAGTDGWSIDYRARGVKGRSVAMQGEPAVTAKLRDGGKIKPIKRSHPMAARMREMLAEDGLDAASIRALGNYRLQITPGTFPGADRVLAIAADSAPSPIDDIGSEYGVVFTMGDGDVVRQVLSNQSDPTMVTDLGDLDGDGFDELLTESSGYESASENLFHLTEAAVTPMLLWSHDE